MARRRRKRAELWLHFEDEAPAIGAGWRGVDVVSLGPKWVKLRNHVTGRSHRLKRAAYERLKAAAARRALRQVEHRARRAGEGGWSVRRTPHRRRPTLKQLFQGDVAIVALPAGCQPRRDNRVMAKAGKLILAEGELTGHHHAIDTPRRFQSAAVDAALAEAGGGVPACAAEAASGRRRPATKPGRASLYRDDALARQLVDRGLLTTTDLAIGFLVVEEAPVVVRHHEHDPLALDPGVYYVGRQREFDAGEVRRVAD